MVFSLLRKTESDSDAQTDYGTLFQTDAAAATKARFVANVSMRYVRSESADMLEEHSHWCGIQ